VIITKEILITFEDDLSKAIKNAAYNLSLMTFFLLMFYIVIRHFLCLSISTAFPCLELIDPKDDKLIHNLTEFLKFRHEQYNLLRQNLVHKGKLSFADCLKLLVYIMMILG
jgi:hypothetical protein